MLLVWEVEEGNSGMYDTYKLMYSCTTKEYLDKDVNTLANEYRATEDKRIRNKAIAAMFCKLYAMMIKVQRRYYTLTNEQKVDLALFHLVKSLENWDSKKMKFSSFYHTHLTNQMKSFLTTENCHKRAAFQNIVDNNEEAMKVYAQETPDKDYELTEDSILKDIKNSQYLSSEEKEYCTCVIKGIDKIKDIRNVLKLEERNNFIKKPLITNPFQVLDLTDKIEKEEKASENRIRKIKNNIKKKHLAMSGLGINIFRD